jgi:hypothetical protein
VRGRPPARIGVRIKVIWDIFARARGPAAVAALAVVVIIARFGFAAPAALADGDPASDVLAGQKLFVPAGLGNSPQIEQLQKLLTEAQRHGFAIRVALIDSASDLGSVGALWGRPGTYARFLGTELSELYGGQVLIVMPAGFGLYGSSSGPHALTAAELRVGAPAPAAGSQLVSSAITAVGILAKAAGHPIVIPVESATTTPAAGGGGPDVVALAAFVAGLVAIAAAWGLSLSRRPLQLHRRWSA